MLSLTIALFLVFIFLLIVWFYLDKNKEPLPEGLRKIFSTKYKKIIHPIGWIAIICSVALSVYATYLWFQFNKMGIDEPIFLVLFAFFVFSTIDIAMAIFINKRFGEYKKQA